MSARPSLSLALALILGLFLASCAATQGYAGAALPKSETALLVGMSPTNLMNLGTTTKVTQENWERARRLGKLKRIAPLE